MVIGRDKWGRAWAYRERNTPTQVDMKGNVTTWGYDILIDRCPTNHVNTEQEAIDQITERLKKVS